MAQLTSDPVYNYDDITGQLMALRDNATNEEVSIIDDYLQVLDHGVEHAPTSPIITRSDLIYGLHKLAQWQTTDQQREFVASLKAIVKD